MQTICKTILFYCFKCRKNADSKNPKVVSTKDGRIMLLSNVQCVTVKNQNFIKNKKVDNY